MRSYTLKPIFEASYILVFLCVGPYALTSEDIYSHMLQIDDKEENARSSHECVQAQRGKKKTA